MRVVCTTGAVRGWGGFSNQRPLSFPSIKPESWRSIPKTWHSFPDQRHCGGQGRTEHLKGTDENSTGKIGAIAGDIQAVVNAIDLIDIDCPRCCKHRGVASRLATVAMTRGVAGHIGFSFNNTAAVELTIGLLSHEKTPQ